jgi:hypothetical protein
MLSPVLQMPTFVSKVYPLSKLGHISAFVAEELKLHVVLHHAMKAMEVLY